MSLATKITPRTLGQTAFVWSSIGADRRGGAGEAALRFCDLALTPGETHWAGGPPKLGPETAPNLRPADGPPQLLDVRGVQPAIMRRARPQSRSGCKNTPPAIAAQRRWSSFVCKMQRKAAPILGPGTWARKRGGPPKLLVILLKNWGRRGSFLGPLFGPQNGVRFLR